MKKRTAALFLCAMLLIPSNVFAAVTGYEETIETYEQDNKNTQIFQIDNGEGETVNAVAKEDTVYVSAKSSTIRSNPGKTGTKQKTVLLGQKLDRVAVCDNGWSKVICEKEGESKIAGYIPTKVLSDTSQMTAVRDKLKVVKDSSILDYPGRKDGEVVGEVLQEDTVTRTATINGIWSRIYYRDDNNKRKIGYIPTNVLEGQEDVTDTAANTIITVDGEEAGLISKSTGQGVFAEAVDGVGAEGVTVADNGVQVGTPVAASSDAVLKSLGTFKITHYCPCSICCGPWANGITSTGVTATTNHTIAVDPTQIPYGSRVVINGQVYVAEDCGGAIKKNCIDIYVATHNEGESKGVYYTDVYLIQ